MSRRVVVLAAAVALLASTSHAQRVELRLSGAWSWMKTGDLALGLRGQSDYMKDQYGANGAFVDPSSGRGGQAEIVFRLGPRFGIGIGGGYFKHARESAADYTSGSMSVSGTVKPDIGVIPVTLNLHYGFPLAGTLRLEVAAGVGYYLATWNWTYRMDLALLGYTGYETYAFEAKRGMVGFQGGISLGWEFARNIALILGVAGRYAAVDTFLGSWTDAGDGDFWKFSNAGTDHTAWYYNMTAGSKTYGQLAFQAAQPSGDTTSNARPAKLDLSAISATLGIRIGFGGR